MPVRSVTRRAGPQHRLTLLVALALLVSACGDDGAIEDAARTDGQGQQVESPQESAATDDEQQFGLSVAVVSFDIAVGPERRLLAGLFTEGAELLSFGEVEFALGYLGAEAGGQVEITERTTASFLPVPGWEPEGSGDRPTTRTDGGRGVYAATVDLHQAGYWGLQVTAELDDGRVLDGQAVFTVAEATQVPDVGDPAPRVANHTIADVETGEVAPVALDSRAQGGQEVPDQHLHEVRIDEAIEAGEPLVVIVSTPVYCRTNFCGPLVETLAETAHDYAEVASFVHLEVYEDFDEHLLNEAAAAWVIPADGSDGGEPWVFVVDADGTIVARWDNILDLEELLTILDGFSTDPDEDT